MNVKLTFLNGTLQEEVFVEQSPENIKEEPEMKVYKLKRTLYELKQAPFAWCK